MKLTIEKYGEFQWWRSWPDNSITRSFYWRKFERGQGYKYYYLGAKLEEKTFDEADDHEHFEVSSSS